MDEKTKAKIVKAIEEHDLRIIRFHSNYDFSVTVSSNNPGQEHRITMRKLNRLRRSVREYGFRLRSISIDGRCYMLILEFSSRE